MYTPRFCRPVGATAEDDGPDTPKGPPAPRMAGGPFGVLPVLRLRVTGGQEALASVFSAGFSLAFGAAGAGLAAS